MYDGKQIVVLVGKIGSGKSYLLNILKEDTATLCIDCDKVVAELKSLPERQEILAKSGLAALEAELHPAVKENVLAQIKKSQYKVVVIEGIKAKELFRKYIDLEIVFNTPEKIRRKRSLARGDSSEKFNFFNKLQTR